MEEIYRLLEDYSIFKLDEKGNFIEAGSFENEELLGESFLDIVSDVDKKKAAKLFIAVIKSGNAQNIIRLKTESPYKTFNLKLIKKEDVIFGIAKEMKRDTPSFISDFLGNMIYAKGKWGDLQDKNIFDVVDEKNKLLEIIDVAIERGEYEGKIFINEEEAKIRINATQWLEFFIEEDFSKIVEEIFNGNDINGILKNVARSLEKADTDFSLRVYDMEYGKKKDSEFTAFPIVNRKKSIGEIMIYNELDEISRNTVKFISIAASKAIERLEYPSVILNDFAVYKMDNDRRLIYGNKKFEELTGYEMHEIRNREIMEFAKERERFFDELEKGKVEDFISLWKGKDKDIVTSEYARKINGETIVVIRNITTQESRGKEAEFYNSILRHDIFNKNEIALGYIGLMEKTALTKKQKDLIVGVLKK